jgi:hypothetical protein
VLVEELFEKYPGAIPFSNLKAHQSPAFNGHSHFNSLQQFMVGKPSLVAAEQLK